MRVGLVRRARCGMLLVARLLALLRAFGSRAGIGLFSTAFRLFAIPCVQFLAPFRERPLAGGELLRVDLAGLVEREKFRVRTIHPMPLEIPATREPTPGTAGEKHAGTQDHCGSKFRIQGKWKRGEWCSRRGSNPQPSASETDILQKKNLMLPFGCHFSPLCLEDSKLTTHLARAQPESQIPRFE